MAEVVAGRLRVELPKGLLPAAQMGMLWDVDTDTQMMDVLKLVFVLDCNADGGRVYADITRLSDVGGEPLDRDDRMPVPDERGGYWAVTQRWLVVEFV